MPAAGLRPGVLAEARPQERHTVEHMVDLVRVASMVQILDAPVPQTVEQLPDILRFFDTLMPDPEQVIEVLQISHEDVSMRTAVRDTQLLEQLVEVPTNPGYALAVVAVQTLGWRKAAALIEQFGDTQLEEVVAAAGEVLVVLAWRGTPPGQGGIWPRVSGRPFDNAARVPAVQVVRVLRRDSVPSTECWTFQLCHRREIPQCSP